MNEEEDEHQEHQQNSSFFHKTFSFVKKIPDFILFRQKHNQVNAPAINEDVWKEKIEQSWNIIDKSVISSSGSQSQEQPKKKQKGCYNQEEEQKSSSSSEGNPKLMKAKLENLLLAYEKIQQEKQKLKQENTIMRMELEEWVKSPIKVRKYARIQGQLSFDEECDEVKVEKASFLQEQEDEG